MSNNYVETRIKEALRAANGNKARATQQIMAWAMQDIKLLLGLARAHLGGIIAYNVDRVASGRSEIKTAPRPKPKLAATSQQGDSFGKELLKAVASSESTTFGMESYNEPARKPQTSQRHRDAMSQIVSASQSKLNKF